MARLEAFGLSVDPDLRTPLYYQLAQALKEAILSGRYAPGQAVPTELALAQGLGLSRATVRQAIQELVQAGYLVRQRGRGTFVAQEKVEQELSRPFGFTQGMERLGHTPVTRVLAFDELPADRDVAAQLAIPPGTPVFRATRLRCAGKVPLAVDIAHLVVARFPGLRPEDLEGSLYALLRERYGVAIAEADETIEAVAASADMARWLQIPRGAPLILTRRTSWDARRNPVEYVERYAAGDRCRFRVHLLQEAQLEIKPTALQEA